MKLGISPSNKIVDLYQLLDEIHLSIHLSLFVYEYDNSKMQQIRRLAGRSVSAHIETQKIIYMAHTPKL